jgi:acetoin utilization deacetylase AcuC-like enzyme
LAVLIDPKNGLLTSCTEFTEGCEGLVLREQAQEVCIGDVFKVHDFNYILKLMNEIKKFQGSRNKIIAHFDGTDTVISEKTWEASLLAAGAVIEACDAVMNEDFRNAFCATRPPGHHAGIFGKTFHDDDPSGLKACSNGFCFINNVALAAAYLKSRYRNTIKRVAIVDFDVHHGNGT